MIFKGWGNGFFKEIFTPGVHRSSWCPLLIFYLNLLKYFLLLIFCLGLTFDLYDGKRGELEGESVLSKDQLKAALVEPPSLLEMLSHSFFIGGYFVGPQFNFRKFKQFASPGFISQLPGSPISYGFRRFGMSIFYMLIHIIGSMYVPAMWPSSPEWSNTSFIKKMLIMPFWCKFILYKYLSAWLLAEGVCIISGLSYNGLKEDGSVNWKGCANVKLRRFETASRFGHLIESFNINTNDWAAAYVYKRLKFMNNRIISQVSTLFFLALWHGFHTGYFFTFMNEFITMNFEKELMVLLERSERIEKLNQNPVARIVMKAIGWVWVFFFMSQCFIGFSLLTWDRYWPAYKDTYFILHLVYLSWPLWRPPFKSFLKLKPKPEKKE